MTCTPTKEQVAEAVYHAVLQAATHERPDMLRALEDARDAAEGSAREAAVLDALLENAAIGACDKVPICQDTGTVWVCLEVGPDTVVTGDVFAEVNDAVARAYTDGRLRMSVLHDALVDRTNTETNAPAFCEVRFVERPGVRLHVLLKGGGSDNASRVVMLAPGAGREGIVREVVACVREKAANACPPLVVGIGVGATFDKVAGLAKHALLRPVGQPSENPDVAAFERLLLEAINDTGIGAGALGGNATAVSVAVETAPCHIAALPLAINLGCSAMRSVTVDLTDGSDGSLTSACQENPPLEGEDRLPRKAACAPADAAIRLTLPLKPEDLASLKAGDQVLLSGPVYTMRDAGHMRALEHLRETGHLPFDLEGQTLFYAGPTPAAAGRPLGSVGPTTSSRMDFATPELLDAGIVACIGKGKRAPEVADACVRNNAVYFAAIGGVAALLATHVTASRDIAWEDLGTEALRELTLEDFPVYVALDTDGRDLYREVEQEGGTI